MRRSKFERKKNWDLLVEIACQSYRTGSWFTAGEWLEARRMLREDVDFQKYYYHKVRRDK